MSERKKKSGYKTILGDRRISFKVTLKDTHVAGFIAHVAETIQDGEQVEVNFAFIQNSIIEGAEELLAEMAALGKQTTEDAETAKKRDQLARALAVKFDNDRLIAVLEESLGERDPTEETTEEDLDQAARGDSAGHIKIESPRSLTS